MEMPAPPVHPPQVEEILRRTPGVLRLLLLGVPPAIIDRPERPGAWSPADVVRHLADLERDGWLPRIHTILDHGDSRPLPAIDRERFRGRMAGRPIEAVLDEFEALRSANLVVLGRLELTPGMLAAVGRHPSLGPVTLSELVHSWAVHDLTHLAQVTRGLAAPFRDAVGPWREYLRVLSDPTS